MDLQLKGKSVLVTGGSKGIGLACAMGFAAEGCNVHIAARDPARLHAAREAIRAAHPVDVTVHAADLRESSAVARLASVCAAADIVVNNAGDIPGGSLLEIDEAKWRHAWDLKVYAYVNLTRSMLASMKQRGSGVILNVVGMAAEKPSFAYVCGATANAGLAAFTRALGATTPDFGVRVLGVHPPATRTDRILAVMRAAAKSKYGDESRVDDVVKDGTFGRLIEPEQVADTVIYLASPRASHLSGVMLNLGA